MRDRMAKEDEQVVKKIRIDSFYYLDAALVELIDKISKLQ